MEMTMPISMGLSAKSRMMKGRLGTATGLPMAHMNASR